MEEIKFQLLEGNKSIKYKYFGSLMFQDMGVSVAFDYPEPNTKSNWHSKLIAGDTCSVAAVLGCLYYYLDDGEDSFKEIYGGDVFTVVNSRQFKDFISKWFDNRGSLFCEPYFFDGFFGTFSDDTYFPRADNADD